MIHLFTKKARRLSFLWFIAWLSFATAQTDLYGPQAPADAAYVRVLQAVPGEMLSADLGGEVLPELEFAQVSPYRVVSPGDVSYTLAESGNGTLAAGAFYTFVNLPSETLVLEDTPLLDASRGLISLYNLTDLDALSLVTTDGAEVVADVAPGELASLEVNEAEVGLAVVAGEDEVAQLEPLLLERGVAHGVFVLNAQEGPVAVYAPSSLAQD